MQTQTIIASEIQNKSIKEAILPIYSEYYVKTVFGKEDDYLLELGSDSYLSGCE